MLTFSTSALSTGTGSSGVAVELALEPEKLVSLLAVASLLMKLLIQLLLVLQVISLSTTAT